MYVCMGVCVCVCVCVCLCACVRMDKSLLTQVEEPENEGKWEKQRVCMRVSNRGCSTRGRS
ncbi:hypothetical protein LY78DRAFT_650331 [Colletotrichum sublineola]|nr:hypothetical protein LY78DRAFT_650331 [Colletotrichum sublineola]